MNKCTMYKTETFMNFPEVSSVSYYTVYMGPLFFQNGDFLAAFLRQCDPVLLNHYLIQQVTHRLY